MDNYNKLLADFVSRLAYDQNLRLKEQGLLTQSVFCYSESGRKFDKVFITCGNNTSIRYFVERSTGNIYGARSLLAPNLKWWFGTLERAPLWQWGDFHGIPLHDDKVRVVGAYAGYVRYMDVE